MSSAPKGKSRWAAVSVIAGSVFSSFVLWEFARKSNQICHGCPVFYVAVALSIL
jgi:hypothetical protein